MNSLPVGFRVVGGVLAGYASSTGGFFAQVLASVLASPKTNARDTPSNDLSGWLVIVFVVTSVILVVAGCLLFARYVAALRAAQLVMVAGIIGLVLEGILAVLATRAEFQHPSGSTGGLIVLVTGPVFMMAVVWTILLLITVVRLGRHLKHS
jgi:hypothetical protein